MRRRTASWSCPRCGGRVYDEQPMVNDTTTRVCVKCGDEWPEPQEGWPQPHLVIHRDRTFTYKGRAYRVTGTRMTEPANRGWGYGIDDVATGMSVVEAGYYDLHELREQAPADIDGWLSEHHVTSRWLDGGGEGRTRVQCSCGVDRTFPSEDVAYDFADAHTGAREAV